MAGGWCRSVRCHAPQHWLQKLVLERSRLHPLLRSAVHPDQDVPLLHWETAVVGFTSKHLDGLQRTVSWHVSEAHKDTT